MSNKKIKILQFCYKPPYPVIDGGTIGMHSISEGLVNNGCDLKILTFYSDKHPFTKDILPQNYLEKTKIEGVYVDLKPKVSDALLCVFLGQSYVVKRFVTQEMKTFLIKTLKREHFDIVQIESIVLAPYISLIRKYSKAKITFHCPNVEHLIWQRLVVSKHFNVFKKWYLKNTALNLKVYELEHINDFDAIFPVTDIDTEYFKNNGCRKLCVGVPIGFDNVEKLPDIIPQSHTLFHIGSMDWFPNEQGIRWFLTDIWDKIHESMPHIKTFLAGRNMPPWLKNGDWENVNVVGEVDDSILFMSSKNIMIVPLLSGSGIRIKILEAMSIGKAVVATSVAAEGIMYENGKNILIADTPEEFVKAIKLLDENAEYCKKVGENAYNLIREKYNTDYIGKELLKYYNQILNRE